MERTGCTPPKHGELVSLEKKLHLPLKINANYFYPIYCVYATYCPIIKKYRK